MNLYGIQFEIALVVLSLIALMFDAFRPKSNERKLGCALALALLGLFVWSFQVKPTSELLFHGLYRLDAFALFFKRLFLLASAFVLVMATEHVPTKKIGAAECFALVLLAATGMMLLASVNDFILMFVALELVTITFYVLTSYLRNQLTCLEAGLKYMVLGALSGGFTVYGISFVFGSTGTCNFSVLQQQLAAGTEPGIAYLFGIVLVVMGLGFKIASVPMQIWAPDVYEGAPTPVTAFLATGSKIAGFAVLLRLQDFGLFPRGPNWSMVLLLLSVATLLYGNLGALPQRDIKRLMGYSSIGHAGYLLMGLAAGSALGSASIMFYLVQYLFTLACVFLVIVAARNATNSVGLSSFAGLYHRSPLLAAGLFISVMSLAGIPPFSGAFGKIFIFLSVLQRAAHDPYFYALAGVGVISVVVSLYFYFGIVKAVYVNAATEMSPIRVSKPIRVALGIAMAAVVLLGIFQQPILAACLELVK